MPALTIVKDFVAGAVLTAADMDNVNCGVKVFANAAARDAAYGGSGERTLEEGEMCYLNDTNAVLVYNGSSWVNAGGVGNAVVSTAAGSYQGTVHEGGTVFDVWTYNASGSLVVTTAGLVDVLLVGAGGGGGGNGAGGGGGGVIEVASHYVAVGTFTVSVPGGGAGGAGYTTGQTSTVARMGNLYVPSGGQGAGKQVTGFTRAYSGACGGGGPYLSSTAGGLAMMPSPHGAGGTGSTVGSNAAGGGGAGQAGGAKNGGNGTTSTYTGTSTTYGGGGGGGGPSGASSGTGGTGGGGNAGDPGAAGSANSGGGGGGGVGYGNKLGGAGGSGRVVVRAAR